MPHARLEPSLNHQWRYPPAPSTTPAHQHTQHTKHTQHTQHTGTPAHPEHPSTPSTPSTPAHPAHQHTSTPSTPAHPAHQHTQHTRDTLPSTPSTPAHQAPVAGVLHKGPHSEVCVLRALSNSAQKVKAAQGASGVGKTTSLPIRTFSNFPPFACGAGCIHTWRSIG